MTPTNRNRVKLLLLAGLFFAPMLIAIALYFGPEDWKPSGSTAHGHLLTPARPIPALSFEQADGSAETLLGQWTVMHLGVGPCLDDCRARLWQTRQMRSLLHRRRGRVQRAYLVHEAAEAVGLADELAAEHPRLKVLRLAPAQREEFQRWLGELTVREPVLLIDPLGNLLMYYGDELPLKGMLSDIKRLLKLSNIG